MTREECIKVLKECIQIIDRDKSGKRLLALSFAISALRRPHVVFKQVNGKYTELFIDGEDVLKTIQSPIEPKADKSEEMRKACKRVRSWLNEEHKEKLTKADCENILFEALAEGEEGRG